MNTEIKKIWIEALTSGNYEQACGALKKGDRFCCLGVLCDLHRKHFNINEWSSEGVYLDESGVLPSEVQKWSGLSDSNPNTKSYSNSSLAELNDDGHTFKEIAEIIEKDLWD